jgi:hypothetical protein
MPEMEQLYPAPDLVFAQEQGRGGGKRVLHGTGSYSRRVAAICGSSLVTAFHRRHPRYMGGSADGA